MDARELAKRVKVLGRVAHYRHGNAAARSVCFRGGSIEATDFNLWLALHGWEGSPAMIDHRALTAALKGVQGPVTVADGVLRVNGTTLPVQSADEFPPVPAMPALLATVHPGDLLRLIEQASAACAEEDGRYRFESLQLTLHNGEMTAAGADGRRLAVATASVEMPIARLGAQHAFLLNAQARGILVELLAKWTPAEGKTVAIYGDGRVVFHCQRWTLHIVAFRDGCFPNYAQHMEKPRPNIGTFDREAMLRAMRPMVALLKHAEDEGSEQRSAEFFADGQACRVLCDAGAHGKVEERVPLSGVMFHGLLDPEFVMDACRVGRGETLGIAIGDWSNGVVIGADGYECLIMPIITPKSHKE